jgi:hypothetical protein
MSMSLCVFCMTEYKCVRGCMYVFATARICVCVCVREREREIERERESLNMCARVCI